MIFKWGKHGSEVCEEAFKVRLKVFVDEQGFSPEIEIDETDSTAMHLAGYSQEGKAICAARLFCEKESIWHAGRIAVLKNERGFGAGRQIMQEIIKMAAQQGAEKLVLGAQFDKAEFYEKCGFTKTGKEYLDEGYPHVEMFCLI